MGRKRLRLKGYVGWNPAKRCKPTYKVYMVVFPNYDFYVGYTSKTFIKRWNNHISPNSNSALKAPIEKFGIKSAMVCVLSRFDNEIQAQAFEKQMIRIMQPPLNRMMYRTGE